jgi:putative transposase
MTAKPIQRLCEGHGMPQFFSRPRTPNDNPFTESAFRTAKRAPKYPGSFLDDLEAVTYLTRYFHWYDTGHYHSGIDFVTPEQAYNGQRQAIIDERRAKAFSQSHRRREENQKKTACKKPRIMQHQSASTPW